MNYKIKITENNRETVKRIADENGMNEKNLEFNLADYYEIENNTFRFRYKSLAGIEELTTEQFIELFDKKGLAGRYFKALVSNAQSSGIIENNFYKIIHEEMDRILFKVPSFTTFGDLFVLDKKFENKYYELMPIGFDPNNNETELEKWLREAKAKNLSQSQLKSEIDTIMDKGALMQLEGVNNYHKANILHNKWQNEKADDQWNTQEPKAHGFCEKKQSECTDSYCDENGCVERKRNLVAEPTEWKPKRGERVLVWDDNEESAKEKIFIIESEGESYPYRVVTSGHDSLFLEGHPFESCGYKHMKPIPKEEPEMDYKSKVIELIEKEISNEKALLKMTINENNLMLASQYQAAGMCLESILGKIKEL